MDFSRFISLLRPYKFFITGSVVTLAIFSMLGLFLPMVLKVIVDDVLPNRDSELLLALLLGLVLIYIVRSLFFYVSHYFTFYTCQRVLFDIRRRLIVHIHSLPIKFYDNTRVGTLITRIINDVGKIQGMVNQGLNQLITQSFSMVLILLIMFCIDWQLTLICLIPLPLFTWNFWRTKRFQLVEQKRLSERISEISGNLSEVLNGARVVKSFDSGKKENRKFVADFRRVFDITLGIQLKSVACAIINEVLVILAVLLMMGAGAYKVWSGLITIGDFISFYSYLWMLFFPIQILTNLSNVLGEGMAGMARIQHILDSPAEVPDGARSLPDSSEGGSIVFERVSFSYGDDKVLNDFNLRVEPGKMVALVGPSGSGKSTLATLLLRFYDVDEGSIKVNNIDIRHIKRKEYREKINAVLQEPYLFSGTIYDNIAYGVSGATREKVEEAARQANAHDFIIELRNGYESVVGEHGIGLSGGQKQRIAIARTLLRDPMVLVLDEATSALDNQSEVEVQEALANLSGTRTIIIIAHRLSTIRDADTIVVMNDGKIAEMGDHSELIKKRGLYYELYKKSAVDKTSLNKRGKTPDLIPMPPRNDFKVITPAI